jgi:VanZ family protein
VGGLLSQFGDSVGAVLVVMSVSAVVAAVVAIRRARSGYKWLSPVARILTAGSALVVAAATATPFSSGFSPDGDLVLAPGGAGLGDLDQIVADPTSLAAILLLSNILLYVPLAFFAAISFHPRRHLALVVCLALSLAAETTQYLLLERVAATDDLILNMVGSLIGYALASMLFRRSSRAEAPTEP